MDVCNLIVQVKKNLCKITSNYYVHYVSLLYIYILEPGPFINIFTCSITGFFKFNGGNLACRFSKNEETPSLKSTKNKKRIKKNERCQCFAFVFSFQ